MSGAGQDGVWLVRYEIGGQQLTDYWSYIRHRWVFDLIPAAVPVDRPGPAA